MEHRVIRVKKCEYSYDVFCNVCHAVIMENCDEVAIAEYVANTGCCVVGDCESLSFYDGPAIPYMEIATPEQFVEYCSKVEKIEMPLDSAKYLLTDINKSGARLYVENDILHMLFPKGFSEHSYEMDLNRIREDMEESIIYQEHFLERMDDDSEESAFMNWVNSGEDELMVGDSSFEEIEAITKTYHEMLDAVWDQVVCKYEL